MAASLPTETPLVFVARGVIIRLVDAERTDASAFVRAPATLERAERSGGVARPSSASRTRVRAADRSGSEAAFALVQSASPTACAKAKSRKRASRTGA